MSEQEKSRLRRLQIHRESTRSAISGGSANRRKAASGVYIERAQGAQQAQQSQSESRDEAQYETTSQKKGRRALRTAPVDFAAWWLA